MFREQTEKQSRLRDEDSEAIRRKSISFVSVQTINDLGSPGVRKRYVDLFKFPEESGMYHSQDTDGVISLDTSVRFFFFLSHYKVFCAVLLLPRIMYASLETMFVHWA